MQDIDTLHECLEGVGYDGKFLNKDLLGNIVTSGPKSEDFRELIFWIANEIHVLSQTEEKISHKTEFSEFMLEISALLKELGCPYEKLISGPLSDRFQDMETKLILFDFLITNLMAAKMCTLLQPEDTSNVIEQIESRSAKALESITRDLNLGKPPENISAKALFEKINKKLILTLDKIDKTELGEPLLKISKPFTEDQWMELEKINKELDKEYNLRKEMLMTRLDVTLQSFLWSDKMKPKQEEIMKIYQQKLSEIEDINNDVDTGSLANLIAARTNGAVIEKVSNSDVRKNTFSAKVQRHIIGKVPDRGGRAFEHDIPPPEMPSWQQNRSTGPQGGGGGRGGGRGGGGNFGGNRGGGGNYNQDNRGGGFNKGGGGNYTQDKGGFNQGGGNYNQDKRGGFNQGGNYNKTEGNGSYNQGSGGSGGGYNKGGGGGFNQGGGSGFHLGGGGYNKGGNGDGYNQSGNGGGYNQGGSSSSYIQDGASGNYNQSGRREGNYNQSPGGTFNQSFDNQQSYGNSNRGDYGQSRIQGRGGNYADNRLSSGESGNRRNDQSGFNRGRSNYNRGGGNRY